jgi:dTDP-4-amino-4,6-dideoxygalactose transaminase
LKDGDVIPVFKPEMNKEEILPELAKIFDSGWIDLGLKTAEFEQRFAEYIGVKYAVGVNPATATLHIANVILGIGLERFGPIQNGG